MQSLHTQMPLFFPKPELLPLIFWNPRTPLVKLLLTAPPLHHYLIIIQPHRYLAIASFYIPWPRIIGILLKPLRTIVSLHYSKISYNLSVKHPCTLLPQLQILLHSQVGIGVAELVGVGGCGYADHCSNQGQLYEGVEEGEGEGDEECAFVVGFVVLLTDVLGRLGLIL